MSQIRKIAYLIDTIACDTAGTQKQLLDTIKQLDRARFAPILVCLWSSPWMDRADLPCETIVLGHRGFLKPGFPGVIRRFARLLDEREIDLVQIFFDEAIFVGWLGWRVSRRRPVLLSSRRDMGLGAANQPWYHRLFPAALALANRDFAAILANSQTVAEYAALREHTTLAKYIVVRNGVEYPPRDDGVVHARSSGAAVGIVASLTPVKRHDLLLRAWGLLGPSGASASLHLFGDGPERSRLERMASDLGIADRVHFHGAIQDVSSRLRMLDLGVLCSDREGLSNAILEYMASGLPVVATAVGGNPELVDAENGLLVPPGDEAALAGAIGALIADADARRKMGEASRRRIADSYAWERAMSSLMGHYDRLLPS